MAILDSLPETAANKNKFFKQFKKLILVVYNFEIVLHKDGFLCRNNLVVVK